MATLACFYHYVTDTSMFHFKPVNTGSSMWKEIFLSAIQDIYAVSAATKPDSQFSCLALFEGWFLVCFYACSIHNQLIHNSLIHAHVTPSLSFCLRNERWHRCRQSSLETATDMSNPPILPMLSVDSLYVEKSCLSAQVKCPQVFSLAPGSSSNFFMFHPTVALPCCPVPIPLGL